MTWRSTLTEVANQMGEVWRLSPKELHHLAYILGGFTQNETAELMKCSFRSVKFHRANILFKSGCRDSKAVICSALFLVLEGRVYLPQSDGGAG